MLVLLSLYLLGVFLVGIPTWQWMLEPDNSEGLDMHPVLVFLILVPFWFIWLGVGIYWFLEAEKVTRITLQFQPYLEIIPQRTIKKWEDVEERYAQFTWLCFTFTVHYKLRHPWKTH
jgi:hypothetical protein